MAKLGMMGLGHVAIYVKDVARSKAAGPRPVRKRRKERAVPRAGRGDAADRADFVDRGAQKSGFA